MQWKQLPTSQNECTGLISILGILTLSLRYGESELIGKKLNLGREKQLGEQVSNHIIGRAVNESNGLLFNDPMNEMVVYVDVLHADVVLMVFHQCNG